MSGDSRASAPAETDEGGPRVPHSTALAYHMAVLTPTLMSPRWSSNRGMEPGAAISDTHLSRLSCRQDRLRDENHMLTERTLAERKSFGPIANPPALLYPARRCPTPQP